MICNLCMVCMFHTLTLEIASLLMGSRCSFPLITSHYDLRLSLHRLGGQAYLCSLCMLEVYSYMVLSLGIQLK